MKKSQNAKKRQIDKRPVTENSALLGKAPDLAEELPEQVWTPKDWSEVAKSEYIQDIVNILRQQNDIILELRTDNIQMKQNLLALNNQVFSNV